MAALLGLTGAIFLFGLIQYRLYFLAAGATFTLAGLAVTLRRSRQTCDVTQHQRHVWLFPSVALISFAASYVLLTYVTPTLVYRSLAPEAAPAQPAQGAPAAPTSNLTSPRRATLAIEGMT